MSPRTSKEFRPTANLPSTAPLANDSKTPIEASETRFPPSFHAGSRNTFAPFREALPTVSPPAFCAVPIVMAEEEVPSIVDMENIPARTFTVLSSAMESVPSKEPPLVNPASPRFNVPAPLSLLPTSSFTFPESDVISFSPSPRIVMACPPLIMIVSPPTKSILPKLTEVEGTSSALPTSSPFPWLPKTRLPDFNVPSIARRVCPSASAITFSASTTYFILYEAS